MMSVFVKLQTDFQQAVLHEQLSPGLFAIEGAGRGGLAIYIDAYQARLTAALRDNFPVLHRALGDDAFAQLAQIYIAAHPSRSRSIRWFGEALPAFLADNPESIPHPALIDLARMDWAMRAAFDAHDAALLRVADLALLTPEDWPAHRFTPVPSLRIIDLSWNIEPIWHALNDDVEAQTEAPEPLAHALLVWRPTLECRWRSADVSEAAALRALLQGASFAECCTAIAASGDADPARRAVTLLQTWIADGLLAGQKNA